jgi:DNA end-binding protein Ku
MPARAIQSATISFGLVSIPIKLFTAAASENISFNLVHAKCSGRMKQQYLCPVDNEVVERSDMVRGYEYAKDQYILFTEQELDALESPKNNSLEILEFVPLTSVDLLYIAKTYYLGPDKGGDKAYKLLSDSMTRTQRIAVGRFWTRGREQLVLIRPYRVGLVLHHVYYANEVRAFDEIDTGATTTFSAVESELADKLIEQLTTERFHPENYRDTYNDRLREAIEQKVAGQQIHVSHQQPSAQIVDLFEALKRSLKIEPANDQPSHDEVQANSAEAQPTAMDEGAVAATAEPAMTATQSNETVSAEPAIAKADPKKATARAKPPKKAEPREPKRSARPATG